MGRALWLEGFGTDAEGFGTHAEGFGADAEGLELTLKDLATPPTEVVKSEPSERRTQRDLAKGRFRGAESSERIV